MPCEVGIIEGEQSEKKYDERNDRIVAIENENHSFPDIRHVSDLGEEFLRELEDFFVTYHQLSGEKYRVLGAKGPAEARKVLEAGMRAFENK